MVIRKLKKIECPVSNCRTKLASYKLFIDHYKKCLRKSDAILEICPICHTEIKSEQNTLTTHINDLHTQGNQIQLTSKGKASSSEDPLEGSSSFSTTKNLKGKSKSNGDTLLNLKRGRLPKYLSTLSNTQRNQLRRKWRGYFSKPQTTDLLNISSKQLDEWRETLAIKKCIVCPTKDCQSQFTSFLGMSYHAKRCNSKRQWRCLICQTCSYTKDIILTHMNSHQEMLEDPIQSDLSKIEKIEDSSSSEEEHCDEDETKSNVKSLEVEISSNKCKDVIVTREVKVKDILKDLEKHFTNSPTYKIREASKIRINKWIQEIEAYGKAICNIENCKKTFTTIQGIQIHSKTCGFDIFWQCLLCKFMTKGQDKLYKHFFEFHPNIIPGKQHMEASSNAVVSKTNGDLSKAINLKSDENSISIPPCKSKKPLSSVKKNNSFKHQLPISGHSKKSPLKEKSKNDCNNKKINLSTINSTECDRTLNSRPKREVQPKKKDIDFKDYDMLAKAKRLKKALDGMKEWEGLFKMPSTTELIVISQDEINSWGEAIKTDKLVCCPSKFCKKAFITVPGMKYHAQRCSVDHVWRCLVCSEGHFSVKLDIIKHLSQHKERKEVTEEVLKTIAQLNHVNEVKLPSIDDVTCISNASTSNTTPPAKIANYFEASDSSESDENYSASEENLSDQEKSSQILSADSSTTEVSDESDCSESSEKNIEDLEELSKDKRRKRQKNQKSENENSIEPANYEVTLKKWNGFYQAPPIEELKQVDTKLYIVWQQDLDKNGIIRCKTPGCSKTYSTILGFKYHYPRCTSDLSWQCLICQAKVKDLRRFKLHMESHNNKMPHTENNVKDLTNLIDSKVVGPIMSRHCEFIKKYFARNTFEYYKPWKELWELIDSSEYLKFLPPLQESMNYKEVNNSLPSEQDSKWKTLSLFSSSQNDLDQDHMILFVGGIVIAAAWCPTSLGVDAKQYLALATSGTMNENPVGDEETCKTSTIIQLWNFGHMTLDGPTQIPELCLSIAHDYGMIWDFAWCPTGAWEDPARAKNGGIYGNILPRLGLLAVAFNFGPIRIYSLPHPDFLEFKQKDQLPIYKTDPFIVLESYGAYIPHISTITKLTWHSLYDCKYVAAGHQSGIVCVWDLSSMSPLSRQVLDDGIKKFTPLKSFKAHKSWVQGISWSPIKDSFALATCSSDRMLYIWDLKSLEAPIFLFRQGLFFDLTWSHLWFGMFVASTTFCEEAVVYKPLFSENKKLLTVHETDLISFSFSEWLGASVSADNGSEVVISHHMNHVVSKKSNKKYALKRSIFKCYTEPLKQDENQTHNPTIYHMSANEGLIFMDIYKDYNSKTINQEDKAEEKNKNLNLHNFLAHSIRSLTWNPNLGSHMWLATATSAGLLRISRIKTVNFGEDLKDILTQAKEWRTSFKNV